MHTLEIGSLSAKDIAVIMRELEQRGFKSSVDGLYWLPVPKSFLSAEQKAHADACGPYAMALEILKSALCLEFLVRSGNKISCSCVAMADARCEAHMTEYLYTMLADLGINT